MEINEEQCWTVKVLDRLKTDRCLAVGQLWVCLSLCVCFKWRRRREEKIGSQTLLLLLLLLLYDTVSRRQRQLRLRLRLQFSKHDKKLDDQVQICYYQT